MPPPNDTPTIPQYVPDDPRGLSAELQDAPLACVPTRQARISLDEMRVLAWLRRYQPQIVLAEKRYNIDRRAIAGAIAWEALKNPHSSIFLWPGPGKVHSVGNYSGTHIPAIIGGQPGAAESAETMGYLPHLSLFGRLSALKTKTGSILYIASIMRMGADIAEEHGFIINDRPDLLTEFYQGWTPEKWRARLVAKPSGSSLAAGDSMAIWVSSHLGYLEDGVGQPSVSLQCKDTRIGSLGSE